MELSDNPDYFDFERVKAHISNFFSYEKQLEYLIHIKAEYIQKAPNVPEVVGKRRFNELCDAEITKIKELISMFEFDGVPRTWSQVESMPGTQLSPSNPTLAKAEEEIKELKNEIEVLKSEKNKSKSKDDLGLNTTQQVLAVRYFLKYLRITDVDKSVIARLVAVLRKGNNYKEIYDKVRDPLLHINNKGADARLIADLYRAQNQPQIAQLIENDLDEITLKRSKS